MPFNQENQQTPHTDTGERCAWNFRNQLGEGSLFGEVAARPLLMALDEPAQVQLLEEDALDFLDLSPASGPRLRSELPGTSGRSKAAWIVLEVWKVRTMFSLGPHFPSLQILKTLPIREVQRRRGELGLTSGSVVSAVCPLRQVPEPLRAPVSYCPPSAGHPLP